uniref:Uncharacterized protein n=1 Tax=Chelonoidis abingdonii TaxID=106734 RepID=A0A8C0GZ28_CHEAB
MAQEAGTSYRSREASLCRRLSDTLTLCFSSLHLKTFTKQVSRTPILHTGKLRHREVNQEHIFRSPDYWPSVLSTRRHCHLILQGETEAEKAQGICPGLHKDFVAELGIKSTIKITAHSTVLPFCFNFPYLQNKDSQILPLKLG